MDWSVLVETKAPKAKKSARQRYIDLAGDLADRLAARSGSVAGDERGWEARISVETGDGPDAAFEAVELGRNTILAAAVDVGIPMWPVIRAEAVEEDTFHAQLEVSNFPDVLGTTEVAELLGITRQRLHQLRSAGRFPEPIRDLAATPLWIRATVDSFVAGWDRTPGRPSWTHEIRNRFIHSEDPEERDSLTAELVVRLASDKHAATVLGISEREARDAFSRVAGGVTVEK
jgi:predicted DNA-binding transcriptional regulator AlpA